MSNSDQVRAVGFFNEDLEKINPKWDVTGVTMAWFDEGPAFTIMIGKKVVGSLGIAKVFNGVGIAWCIMDRDIPGKFKRRVALICKEELVRKMDRFNFHRVQADIAMSFDDGRKFVEFVGMKSEGVMRAFGPDKEDYERYAMVRC